MLQPERLITELDMNWLRPNRTSGSQHTGCKEGQNPGEGVHLAGFDHPTNNFASQTQSNARYIIEQADRPPKIMLVSRRSLDIVTVTRETA